MRLSGVDLEHVIIPLGTIIPLAGLNYIPLTYGCLHTYPLQDLLCPLERPWASLEGEGSGPNHLNYFSLVRCDGQNNFSLSPPPPRSGSLGCWVPTLSELR
jgi:hypothetical protein